MYAHLAKKRITLSVNLFSVMGLECRSDQAVLHRENIRLRLVAHA